MSSPDGVAPGPPDCSVAQSPPAPVGTLAFVATAQPALVTYAVTAAGCWVRMDEDAAAADMGSLSVDPTGRFLYGSARVDPSHTGIEAFRIDAAAGRLDPIGRFPLDTDWWERPGAVVATSDSVYTTTLPLGTGYHGGFWRFSIDGGSGRLTWRGAPFRAREPGMLEWSPPRALLFVWVEDLGPPFRPLLRSLRIGPGGTLSPGSEAVVEYGRAEADPAGSFLWMASGLLPSGYWERLEVYAVGLSGALTPTASLDWGRGVPAAHPSGRVLYAASAAGLESFVVDPQTGAPSPRAAAPHQTGTSARVAADPSGAFVFSVGPSETLGYRTDAAGSLIRIGRVAPGGGPFVLARGQ